jgi:hypothetical protein
MLLDIQKIVNFKNEPDLLKKQNWGVYGYFHFKDIEWFITEIKDNGYLIGKQIDKNGCIMTVTVQVKILNPDHVVLLDID